MRASSVSILTDRFPSYSGKSQRLQTHINLNGNKQAAVNKAFAVGLTGKPLSSCINTCPLAPLFFDTPTVGKQ